MKTAVLKNNSFKDLTKELTKKYGAPNLNKRLTVYLFGDGIEGQVVFTNNRCEAKFKKKGEISKSDHSIHITNKNIKHLFKYLN